MSGYIQVAEDEGEDVIEIPVEIDDTLLLSTLSAQFPGACGLKYRHPDTKTLRGVRLVEERLIAPEDGWGFSFFCSFPKNDGKRKSCDLLESSTHKTKRMDVYRKCSDLIVLGLPWKTTEEELKEHFGMYGDVIMAQIKKDTKTGLSRGYGFIRFDDFEVQKRVLNIRHVLDGRTCDVKVPNSKASDGNGTQHSGKIFVGRTTEDLTAEDLREYFEKFGEVTDVFIPKPFRAFAFVTFLDPETAQNLCGEDHIVKGVSVNISSATPKGDRDRDGGRQGGGGGFMGGQQGRYGRGNNWNNGNGGGQTGGSYNNGGRGGNQGSNQGPWNSPGQGSAQPWGQQGGNNTQWNQNYPQGGNAQNMGGQDMNCFDPKNMNMGALTMPFMAALSQQLLGQMNPQMMQQQMMEQQYGNASSNGVAQPQQQQAVSNNSYPPPPQNQSAPPPSTPTNAPPPPPNWNNTPRHDKYNRHSYHDGKTEGY